MKMDEKLSTTVHASFGDAVEQTRMALSREGFGVLTEIDVQGTLHAEIGVDMEDYLILGACNPPLAHRAHPPGFASGCRATSSATSNGRGGWYSNAVAGPGVPRSISTRPLPAPPEPELSEDTDSAACDGIGLPQREPAQRHMH